MWYGRDAYVEINGVLIGIEAPARRGDDQVSNRIDLIPVTGCAAPVRGGQFAPPKCASAACATSGTLGRPAVLPAQKHHRRVADLLEFGLRCAGASAQGKTLHRRGGDLCATVRFLGIEAGSAKQPRQRSVRSSHQHRELRARRRVVACRVSECAGDETTLRLILARHLPDHRGKKPGEPVA